MLKYLKPCTMMIAMLAILTSNTTLSADSSNQGNSNSAGACAGYLFASAAFLTLTPNASENNMRIGREMMAISNELSENFNSNAREYYTFLLEQFNEAVKAGNLEKIAQLKAVATIACNAISVSIPE